MSKENEKSEKSNFIEKPKGKSKRKYVKWADKTEEQKAELQARYFIRLNNFFKTK